MTQEEEKELVYWTSKGQGLTHGRGNTLAIETTALVAYAFLKSRQHAAIAHKALAWLIVKKDGRGTWHSTQATVHAMRSRLPPPPLCFEELKLFGTNIL